MESTPSWQVSMSPFRQSFSMQWLKLSFKLQAIVIFGEGFSSHLVGRLAYVFVWEVNMTASECTIVNPACLLVETRTEKNTDCKAVSRFKEAGQFCWKRFTTTCNKAKDLTVSQYSTVNVLVYVTHTWNVVFSLCPLTGKPFDFWWGFAPSLDNNYSIFISLICDNLQIPFLQLGIWLICLNFKNTLAISTACYPHTCHIFQCKPPPLCEIRSGVVLVVVTLTPPGTVCVV